MKDNRISSAARYGLFANSPDIDCPTGIPAADSLLILY